MPVTLHPENITQYVDFAISLGKRLRIGYVDRKGNQEVRVIEPFDYNGEEKHVIQAYCCLRKQPRHFSVANIARISVLDEDIENENPFTEKKKEVEEL